VDQLILKRATTKSRIRQAPIRTGLDPAQASAVLDHSRTLPQGDGSAGPAFAGCAEGGERNLIVLDASDTMLSPSGVQVSTRKVKCVCVFIAIAL
jgi:hypothetical protein